MAQTHPVEEEVPKGRKTRLSQRQEGRGQERGRGRARSPLPVPGVGGTRRPGLWPFLQRQIKDQLGRGLNCSPGLPMTVTAAGINASRTPGGAERFP